MADTDYANLVLSLRGQHMVCLRGESCEGLWPVVDGNGILTGAVSDGQDGGALVDWDEGVLSNRNDYACEAILLGTPTEAGRPRKAVR